MNLAFVSERIAELQAALRDCDCQSEDGQIIRQAALALIRTYQRIQLELVQAEMNNLSVATEKCDCIPREN